LLDFFLFFFSFVIIQLATVLDKRLLALNSMQLTLKIWQEYYATVQRLPLKLFDWSADVNDRHYSTPTRRQTLHTTQDERYKRHDINDTDATRRDSALVMQQSEQSWRTSNISSNIRHISRAGIEITFGKTGKYHSYI
jgi:hypothetical protein